MDRLGTLHKNDMWKIFAEQPRDVAAPGVYDNDLRYCVLQDKRPDGIEQRLRGVQADDDNGKPAVPGYPFTNRNSQLTKLRYGRRASFPVGDATCDARKFARCSSRWVRDIRHIDLPG